MSYEPRRYRVRHITRYNYDDVLEACYNRGLLQPRETPTQRVLASDVRYRFVIDAATI